MNVLKNIKIGVRIAIGFGIVISLALILGLTAWLRVQDVGDEWHRFESKTLQKRNAINTGLSGLQDGIHHFKNYVLRGDDYAQKFSDDMLVIENAAVVYRQVGDFIDDEALILDQIEQGVKDYRQALAKAIELRGQGKNSNEIDKAVKGADKPVDSGFKKLRELNATRTQNASDQIGRSLTKATVWIISICLSIVFIGVLCAWTITRSVVRPLNVVVDAANKIANGDLSFTLDTDSQDETGILIRAMSKTQDSVQALITDAQELVKAAVDGNLSARADASQHQGDFQAIIQGINNVLDAVIQPLNVAASYVDHIAKGKIPPKITDAYNGDFNIIKDNLNTCIDAINALVQDADLLANAAVQGQLDTRADVDRHFGDFRKIVEGVNHTLDAIVDPVNDVVRVLDALAAGNLTETMYKQYQGTFGNLKDDVNATVHQLTDVILRIKQAADTVNSAASEIASGSANLSQRTETQSASLEETAASMEELTTTVKHNAEHAQEASQLAVDAADIAKNTGEVVGQVVQTMSSINDSSKKIVAIIGVIDGIAFQTNILALNAAVEAARAGEHGRGFAVVASEVRSLAQRAASAANEVKVLINNSVREVSTGTDMAHNASRAMQNVVYSTVSLTDIMSKISAASVEQSAGIEQVNQAIRHMDAITQQNSALVEESINSVASLNDQAKNLISLLATFQVS